MSLAAVLKQAGHDVALTVATEEDPVARAIDYQPDILAYSVLTGSQMGYLALNQRLRAVLAAPRSGEGKPPVFSVFGGPHPTFFPEMIEEPESMASAAARVRARCLIWPTAWPRARSAPRYRTGGSNSTGRSSHSPVRPLVPELSTLPSPDRALVYDRHPQLAQSAIKHFITSRGCPFDCTYCFNHALHELYPCERRHYRRTVDDVIGEVQEVRSRWSLEHVVFVDDLFIVDKRGSRSWPPSGRSPSACPFSATCRPAWSASIPKC